MRFKNELERNITIKLGYANAKIFKAVEGAVPGPGNFRQAQRREGVRSIGILLWYLEGVRSVDGLGVSRSVGVLVIFDRFRCFDAFKSGEGVVPGPGNLRQARRRGSGW